METKPAVKDPNIELINKQFDALKLKVTQAGQACLNIKITDAVTLALAEQKLASAKEVENLIDALHTRIKAQPLSLCQQIDLAKRNLMALLTPGVLAFKEEKKKYILAEAAKKQKELDDAKATLEVLNDNPLIEDHQEIKGQLESKVMISAPVKAKGTREVWKWEVVNFDDVPRGLLMVNPDKVKEFMNLKDKVEQTTHGIRFFKDITIVAG